MCKGESFQRVQILSKVENSDLTAPRNEYYFETPVLSALFLQRLKDERDAPMVHLTLNIIAWYLVYVPLMYYFGSSDQTKSWCHVMGVVNLLALILGGLLGRFVLMLHYSSHRSAFKDEWLNNCMLWVLPPLFGMPCGVYKLHHCVMHHIENNHGLDISATDIYQRDSFPHFLCYWLRFSILIWVELPIYALRTKRWNKLCEVLSGLGIWGSIVLVGMKFAPLATTWAFLVPYFLLMLALSFGNWSQHMFVDPTNSRSNYALTYNCIDACANRKTFNDGYHILHHFNARLHWSEMPSAFHASIDKHRAENALTFRELDFFEVGMLVMTGQLHKLASKYYVHLGDEASAPTVDEMVAKFHSWLKPVTVTAEQAPTGKKAE